MKNTVKTSLLGAALVIGMASLLTACPKGGVPGAPGIPGRGASKVDPNTCGNYAASDAGRKLQAFLEATVKLDAAVSSTESYVRDTCSMMGAELGVDKAVLSGDTRTACMAVSDALKAHMQVGLKAGARLKIDYQPAVCVVNVEAAASAAAKCEAKAEADVSVRCSGSCQGTCQGTCKGTCKGAAGTGQGASGQCNGQCQGTCEGSCSGGCEGHADVQADASCKAKAEVYANVEAKCTEPELNISFDAAMVADKSKLDAAIRAVKKGMPRLLMVQAKMTGPVKAAFTGWSKASAQLAGAGRDLVSSLGDQALCVSGQIAAAAGMVTNIEASISVQVEVSAEISGSASGGAGASLDHGSSQMASSPLLD